MSFIFDADHPFEDDGESRYCRRCNLLRFMHDAEDTTREEPTR